MILLLGLLLGCGGGVSQGTYKRLEAQLEAAQAQVAELRGEISGLQAQNKDTDAQLKAAKEKIAVLESKIGGLQEQYELIGGTIAETAENIVRHYYETHSYSKIDYFICSDMAKDVWNMLKAQDIVAIIQVGNVETGVGDIVESDHAWVLAEVAPGEYLALETTAGYVVTRDKNELYYQGWSFDNPREIKEYDELLVEYNTRVDIINQLQGIAEGISAQYQTAVDYYNELVDEFNSKYADRPVSTESQLHEAKIEAQSDMMGEKEDRYNSLIELIGGQNSELESIFAEINGLATGWK
ncbi:hypothetical protein ACFLXZ_00595 [Chloroflexota bacterium]